MSSGSPVIDRWLWNIRSPGRYRGKPHDQSRDGRVSAARLFNQIKQKHAPQTYNFPRSPFKTRPNHFLSKPELGPSQNVCRRCLLIQVRPILLLTTNGTSPFSWSTLETVLLQWMWSNITPKSKVMVELISPALPLPIVGRTFRDIEVAKQTRRTSQGDGPNRLNSYVGSLS